LSLLRLLDLVSDDFDLAAELGDIGLDLLDRVEQVHQPLTLQLLVDLVDLLRELRHPLVGRIDALARLLIVEEAGTRERCKRTQRESDGERACSPHRRGGPARRGGNRLVVRSFDANLGVARRREPSTATKTTIHVRALPRSK
jgi:hypothetical protein